MTKIPRAAKKAIIKEFGGQAAALTGQALPSFDDFMKALKFPKDFVRTAGILTGKPGATLDELLDAHGAKRSSPNTATAPAMSRNASAIPDASMAHPDHRRGRNLRRVPWKTTGDKRGLNPQQEKILDRAFFHIQSVTYPVSLRWLFYRLLQEGFYKGKADYKNKFDHLISRARHTCFKDWRPDTLADETREIIYQVGGYRDVKDAKKDLKARLLDAAGRTKIDHFYRQKFYTQIWFEARAMGGQFQQHTSEIDLAPMGGSASIPMKWAIAKALEAAAARYDKPIMILYFGDADKYGQAIAEASRLDVTEWSSVPFTFRYCGLTEEQAKDYGIPANPDKPGYQWEALEDEAAREIITEAIAEFVDQDIIDRAKTETVKTSTQATKAIKKLLKRRGKRAKG